LKTLIDTGLMDRSSVPNDVLSILDCGEGEQIEKYASKKEKKKNIIMDDDGSYFSRTAPIDIGPNEYRRRLSALGIGWREAHKGAHTIAETGLPRGKKGHALIDSSHHTWKDEVYDNVFKDWRRQNPTVANILFSEEFFIPKGYVPERFLMQAEIPEEELSQSREITENYDEKFIYEIKEGDAVLIDGQDIVVMMIDFDSREIIDDESNIHRVGNKVLRRKDKSWYDRAKLSN
jgi:hypothetical protein